MMQMPSKIDSTGGVPQSGVIARAAADRQFAEVCNGNAGKPRVESADRKAMDAANTQKGGVR